MLQVPYDEWGRPGTWCEWEKNDGNTLWIFRCPNGHYNIVPRRKVFAHNNETEQPFKCAECDFENRLKLLRLE